MGWHMNIMTAQHMTQHGLLTLIIWTLNPSVAADSQGYFHF